MGEVARACLARYLAIQASRRPPSETSSFAVSEEEAELAAKPSRFSPPEDFPLEGERIGAAAAALDEALAAAPEPRLARLQRVCQLGHLDLLIVCVLLAPELDHELERAYTFALDDFTRKRPRPRVRRADDRRRRRRDDRSRADPVRRRRTAAPLRRGRGRPRPTCRRSCARCGSPTGSSRSCAATTRSTSSCAAASGSAARSLRADDVVMNPELVAADRRARSRRSGRRALLLAGPEGVGRGLAVEALIGRARARRAARRSRRASSPRARSPSGSPPRCARPRCATPRRSSTAAASIDDAPRALVQAIADRASTSLAVPVVFAFDGAPRLARARRSPSSSSSTCRRRRSASALELWRRALPPALAEPDDLETVASRYAFTGATIARAAHRAGRARAAARSGDARASRSTTSATPRA